MTTSTTLNITLIIVFILIGIMAILIILKSYMDKFKKKRVKVNMEEKNRGLDDENSK